MCSKDLDGPHGSTSHLNEQGTATIVAKIQRFRSLQKTEFREKSIVEYTAKEAEQIFEGSFNWDTVDPHAHYGEMKEDKFEASIPWNDGKVSEADLLNAYAELEAAMSAAPLEADDKLHLMDV